MEYLKSIEVTVKKDNQGKTTRFGAVPNKMVRFRP